MDPALRDLALKAMGAEAYSSGFRYQGDFYRYVLGTDGTTVVVGRDAAVADTLKRAYSAEIVKYTARRAGWGVKQVSPFQYQVVKR